MNEYVLTGQIIAESVVVGNPKWGSIGGDISNQTDLFEALAAKENTEVAKIATFFNEHSDYNYQYLISMKDQPIDSAMPYFQLIFRDYMEEKPLWIPYSTDKLCLVILASSVNLGEAVRFYVPATGEIGFVKLNDETSTVKFTYKLMGDDVDEAAQWGNIMGDISSQSDLMALFAEKVAYADEADPEDIEHMFDLNG